MVITGGPKLADDDGDERVSGRGLGTLGTAVGALFAAWAAAIASFPLDDNSFLTHLATGRLILDEGSVPTTDPYTYTAAGVDWTVQSWLPSVVYAGAERIGGDAGLRAVVLAVVLAAFALLWRLSRPAESIIVRLSIVAVVMLIAMGMWGERPYMVGVIGIGLVWLALDGSVRPWVMVPLLWVWGNSHGSYPLAFVLIALVLVGTLADRWISGAELSRTVVSTELRVLGMALVGVVVAAVGPLGPEVWTFPLKAVTQSDVLADIVEWQPPRYRTIPERAFLVLALISILALARRGSWRKALPAVAFAGLALYTQRNIVMATMVLVPVVASSAPLVGTLRSRSRPAFGTVVAGIAGLTAVAVAVASLQLPAAELDRYPAHAVAWLTGPSTPGDTGRLASQDKVGNFLEVLGGFEGEVFVDDRADMFPADVFEDAIALVGADARWSSVLDQYAVDVVLWEREEPLASLLAADPAWQVVYSDTAWIVARRRTTSPTDA